MTGDMRHENMSHEPPGPRHENWSHEKTHEVGWQTRSGGWLPQGKGKEDNDLPVPHTNLGEKSPLPPSPPTTGALFKRSPFSPCQVIRAPDLFTSSSSPSPLRVSMVRVGGWLGGDSVVFFF